jgi:hypothetical protein
MLVLVALEAHAVNAMTDAQIRHDHKTLESATAPIGPLAVIHCVLFANGWLFNLGIDVDSTSSVQSIAKVGSILDIAGQLSASGINIVTSRLADGRHYCVVTQNSCK